MDSDANFVRMAKSGYRAEHIASVLGCGRQSVLNRSYRLGVSLAGVTVERSAPDWRAPIPAWVPAVLHEEYDVIAFEDGEHAAASWARAEKRRLLGLPPVVAPVRTKPPQATIRSPFGSLPKVQRAARLIARMHNIDPRDLILRSMRKRIVWPRQKLIWIMRRHTKLSLEQIARRFDMDHTTVLHAIRRVEETRR